MNILGILHAVFLIVGCWYCRTTHVFFFGRDRYMDSNGSTIRRRNSSVQARKRLRMRKRNPSVQAESRLIPPPPLQVTFFLIAFVLLVTRQNSTEQKSSRHNWNMLSLLLYARRPGARSRVARKRRGFAPVAVKGLSYFATGAHSLEYF